MERYTSDMRYMHACRRTCDAMEHEEDGRLRDGVRRQVAAVEPVKGDAAAILHRADFTHIGASVSQPPQDCTRAQVV